MAIIVWGYLNVLTIMVDYDPHQLVGAEKLDLILEYHILRKNGAVLGETIFDDGPVILYDMDERSYKVIAVRKGTILVDERLCEARSVGRLRFTCAHAQGTHFTSDCVNAGECA